MRHQSHILPALAFALVAASSGISEALAVDSFTCGGSLNFIVETAPPAEGWAQITTQDSTIYADVEPDGRYSNPDEELHFDLNTTPPTLWLGSEQFSCLPVMANNAENSGLDAVSGNKTARQNTSGRSLGGKLRAGPGMNFVQIGSLGEGDQITILRNTGISFNGHDWFEIKTSDKTGFQWGGIMCSDGPAVQGIYTSCDAPVPIANGDGPWMVFAIGSDGKFGHGTGNAREKAEEHAMRSCGDSSCEIVDETLAECHALAQTADGSWFGASAKARDAEALALGYCAAAGASCKITYSYCR